VRNDRSETLFESGAPSPTGRILPEGAAYQPHWSRIERGDQVQVYEGVMEDSRGEPTTTLLRAARYVKDNRLPPHGFVRGAPEYADTAIVGAAASDADFNHEGPEGGTGRDTVEFVVDVTGESGVLSVLVEVLHQTVPPRFVDHLREVPTEAGQTFAAMFDTADRAPALLRSLSVDVHLDGNLPGPRFWRGDVNADDAIDLSDSVSVLLYLFQAGSTPPCGKSADANDDGNVNLSDAAFLLQFLFRSGSPPPPPFPGCGVDVTADLLGCRDYAPCGA
jgi:hypothetical protein